MQSASVAVATDLSADSQCIPSPIPDPERSRARALLIACLVIGIERFAFYQVFSLYTLFLMQRHRMTEAQATSQYGLLIGSVYMTPFLGGVLADRIGRRPAVALGTILITIAYAMFAADRGLLLSVAMLAAGMGLFKGNLTAAVGSLFETDPERDAAMSRFYWAINLGALPSGIVGAWLSSRYGYAAAFLSCAAATLLCCILWLSARDYFPDRQLKHGEDTQFAIPESDRIKTLLTLLPVPLLFFLAFHQSGSSLTLFAAAHTRETLLGVPIAAPIYQSIQAALVIGLTPLLVRLWRCWSTKTYRKLLMGMVLCSASCLVMVGASVVGGNVGRVSPLWLLCSYLLISIAELCVSPIGFSLVSRLAPPRIVGLLMGLWLSAISIGNYLAGFLGVYWKSWPHHSFFGLLAATSVLAIPLLWSQRSRLERVLKGIEP